MKGSLARLYWATVLLVTAAQAFTVAPLEVVQISSYYAQNCKANNEHIAALLATLVHALQPVITDLSSSVSSDAYTTFFRDIAYAPYVREVIYNITKGVPVPPEPGSSSLTPVFYCVDGRDQITYFENDKKVDTYTQCRTGNHAAMTLLKTPYIVICPVFFTQPAVPVRSTASCLTVDPHQNLFVGDGKSLYKYQLWHVLHELVHYYVYSTKGNALEVFPINICLFLFGEAAVLNAQSYIYYAANILLKCTKFPTVRTRPSARGGNVELLEIDANRTALDANDSIALVVQNVSFHAEPPVPTFGGF